MFSNRSTNTTSGFPDVSYPAYRSTFGRSDRPTPVSAGSDILITFSGKRSTASTSWIVTPRLYAEGAMWGMAINESVYAVTVRSLCTSILRSEWTSCRRWW